MDIDISGLEVNQCDTPMQNRNDELEALPSNQIAFFKGTHKCHSDTTQVSAAEAASRDPDAMRNGNETLFLFRFPVHVSRLC